jgi:hypothetical protein
MKQEEAHDKAIYHSPGHGEQTYRTNVAEEFLLLETVSCLKDYWRKQNEEEDFWRLRERSRAR